MLEIRKMSKPSNSSNETSPQPTNPLEQAHLEILQAMRDSGRTVTETEASDTGEYKVTFPPGRAPATRRGPSGAATEIDKRSGPSASISVEWGYEMHEIILSPTDWANVLSGESLGIKGPGYYYENVFFQDYWGFGGGMDGRLEVTYGDDGGTGFIGTLRSAVVRELPAVNKKRTRRK